LKSNIVVYSNIYCPLYNSRIEAMNHLYFLVVMLQESLGNLDGLSK
jgi:hypothetical protein